MLRFNYDRVLLSSTTWSLPGTVSLRLGSTGHLLFILGPFSLATYSFDGQGYAAVLSLTPTRVDWPSGKTRHHVEGARTKHQLRVRAKNERSTSGPFLVGSRCVLLPGFLFAVLPGDRFGRGLVP